MSDKPANITAQAIDQWLRDRGVDLTGFALAAPLTKGFPEYTAILEPHATVIIFAKRILKGISWSRHLANKQIAGGRNVRFLEKIAIKLSTFLEDHDHIALPLHPLALDFEKRLPDDLTPAGQGSGLVREAAIAAGMGTYGLNTMVLTPEFGPRVYFSAVATSHALPTGTPLTEELCLGLESCGRCAAICPEDAIPRRAPVGSSVASCRGLDCSRCAHSSQPYGYENFINQFQYILDTHEADAMLSRLLTRESSELWKEMAMMKEAAITGCNECMQVCPIGEDYETISASPQRQQDIPGDVERTIRDGIVTIISRGPSLRRQRLIERRDT